MTKRLTDESVNSAETDGGSMGLFNARRIEQYAMGFSSLGYSYRVDVYESEGGSHYLAIMVLDPAPNWRPGESQQWAQRYIHETDSYATAQIAQQHIANRLRDLECLACGSVLLTEEIHEFRGIYCYRCGGAQT